MKNADTILIRSITALIFSTLTFLVLSFVVALSLPALTDPSHYKARMADVVLEKTGRHLTLEGHVQINLFPKPSITLEQISLGNAPGFGPAPMVTIERMHGNLQLMKLLQNEFAVQVLSATGVRVVLERNAAGDNNWDDLVARTRSDEETGLFLMPADPPDTPSNPLSATQLAAISLAALSARGITLNESEIRFCGQDATTQAVSCLTASRLHVVPVPPQSGQPTEVHLQADLKTQTPPFSGHVTLATYHQQPVDAYTILWRDTRATVRGHIDRPPVKELELTWHSDIVIGPTPQRVQASHTNSQITVWSDTPLFRAFSLSLEGQLEADMNTGQLHLPDGGMAWHVKADYLPPAGVKLAFQSAIHANWHEGTLTMEHLKATGPAHMRIEGRLQGTHLLSQPTLDADITTFHFDPRALLIALGRPVPPTTDPKAISSAELAATLHLDEQEMVVSDMRLGVDDSLLSGHVRWNTEAVVGEKTSIVRFDLHGDTLDLDRYLPPTLTTRDQSGRVLLAMIAPELFLPFMPARLFDRLDLQGGVRIDRLQVAQTHTTDVSLDFKIAKHQLDVQPYHLTLHGGQMSTRARMDVRGDVPVITLDKTITHVSIQPLLETLRTTWPGRVGWTGQADLTLHLESQGRQPDALQNTLDGTLALVLHDGSIQGMDVVARIRESYRAMMERRAERHPPTLSKAAGEAVTRFSKLTATGTVTHGILTSQDLLMVSPTLKITGKGTVDLPRSSVDFFLEADAATSLQGISPQNAANLQGLVLPIRVRGPVDGLKIPSMDAVDFARLLHSAVRTPRIQKMLDPLSKKQRAQVLEEIDRFSRQLGGREGVRGILRQLLGVEK